MKTLLIVVVSLIGIVAVLIIAHLAVIELGREVVTLRTADRDGTVRETRLWIVDVNGTPWLHSAGPAWAARFVDDPVVEVVRHGHIGRYRATLVPAAHPEVDAALRQKYGLADRWVRWIAPCGEDTIPVRLEPVPGTARETDLQT